MIGVENPPTGSRQFHIGRCQFNAARNAALIREGLGEGLRRDAPRFALKLLKLPERVQTKCKPEGPRFAPSWWAYQAGDLGRIACEALLKWLLDTIETHTTGVQPSRAIAEAVDALDAVGAGWPGTWRQLVAALPMAANPLSQRTRTSERALAEVVLDAGRGEERAELASGRAAIG